MNPTNTNRKEYIVSCYTQGQIWFVVCWKYDPEWDDGAGNIREDYAKDYATYLKPENFPPVKNILEGRDLPTAILNLKDEDDMKKSLYAYINAAKADYWIEYVTVAEGNVITALELSKTRSEANNLLGKGNA